MKGSKEGGREREEGEARRRGRDGVDVRMKLSGSISSMTVDFPTAGTHMTSFRSGVEAEMMICVCVPFRKKMEKTSVSRPRRRTTGGKRKGKEG
jgi:hypothetical protein